jgi:Cu2+-exporting ATPase
MVGLSEDEVLQMAAAVASDSEHPLARAIVATGHARGLVLPPVTEFRAAAPVGVVGIVVGHTVRVGGPHLVVGQHPEALTVAEGWTDDGATVLHVLRPAGSSRDIGRRRSRSLGRLADERTAAPGEDGSWSGAMS